MKKLRLLLAGVLSAVTLASCVKYGSNRDRSRFSGKIDAAFEECGAQQFMNEGLHSSPAEIEKMRKQMDMFYGENKEIKDNKYSNVLAAKTANGTYVGKAEGQYVATWKGIPYAKAPINELRWKAPQKLDASDKVYEAYYFGPTAVQMECSSEPSAMYPQSEDCLHLNVWNNTLDETTKKPVLVWIHGGGYILGGTAEPQYDGCNFVTYNPDVIYVSIDYRVDMLGFINLTQVPGGEEYKESANLGLLDEVAALSWIHENIAAFGGDPDRVTIFGESAGGGSVSALTIMPQAKGLFKRAIIQSGSVTNLLRTTKESVQQTQNILDITGAKTVEDLLELTPSDIRKLSIIRTKFGGPASYTFPELDGVVLPKNIKDVMDNSDVRDGLDIMSGTTADEYQYWSKIYSKEVNGATIKAAINKFYTEDLSTPEQRARFDQFRATLPEDEYDRNVETVSYTSFHTPCRYEAKSHAKNGNKVYQYLFTEKATQYGSYHGFELGFLFGNLSPDISCELDEAVRLSLVMQRMWVNFAKNGDPSIAKGDFSTVDEINWEPYNVDTQKVMLIDSDMAQTHTVEDPFKANIDLIGDLYWTKVK